MCPGGPFPVPVQRMQSADVLTTNMCSGCYELAPESQIIFSCGAGCGST